MGSSRVYVRGLPGVALIVPFVIGHLSGLADLVGGRALIVWLTYVGVLGAGLLAAGGWLAGAHVAGGRVLVVFGAVLIDALVRHGDLVVNRGGRGFEWVFVS